MAITHDDIALRSRRLVWQSVTSHRLTVAVMAGSVLCGFFSFILCLAAEGSRSQAAQIILGVNGGGQAYQCIYSGSGRTALMFAIAAFILLALAMFMEHAYMLLAVTSPTQPSYVTWPAPEDPQASHASKALTRQACFLFLTTWICFALAELLLIIGIGVESGHLDNWTQPRSKCPVIRPGLFAVAGIFGLLTVLVGVALYQTALKAQKLHQEEENRRQGTSGPPPHAPHHHQFLPTAPPALRSVGEHENSPETKTSTSA